MGVVGMVLSIGFALSMLGIQAHQTIQPLPDLMQPAPPNEQPAPPDPNGAANTAPADPPQVTLSGADPSGIIAVVTTSAKLRHNIMIQEVANRSIREMNVVIWPMNGPVAGSDRADRPDAGTGEPGAGPVGASGRIGPVFCGTTTGEKRFATFSARDYEPICIDVSLPSIGISRMTLSVSYLNERNVFRRDNYTLSVERRTPATTFALSGLPVGPVEAPFLSLSLPPWLGGRADGLPDDWPLSVRATISEIAGQEVDILAPRLVQFSQYGANDTIVQYDPGRVNVKNEEGQPIETWQPQRLMPKASKAVNFELPKRPGPGQYRAKIEASTADGAVAQSEIDIRVRHGWVPAFMVIVVGALVSYAMRQWIVAGRLRVFHEHKIDQLITTLRGDRDDPLVSALLDRMEDARDEFLMSGAVPVDELCRDTEELLNHVRDLRGRIRSHALPSNLAHLVDGAEVRARGVLAMYAKEHVGQSRAALKGVEQALALAARAQPLQARIANLRSQVDRAPNPAQWTHLSEDLDDVQRALDDGIIRTQAVLASGEGDPQVTLDAALAESQAQYENAARLYIDACHLDLKPVLDAWASLLTGLQANDNHGLAPQRLEAARLLLERAMTASNGFHVPDDLDASLEKFDAIVREIQQVEQHLPATTLRIVVQDAALLPPQIQPRLKPAPVGARSAVLAESVPPAMPRDRREGTLAERAWRLLPPQRKVQIFDVGVTIVVAIFSALIGIQLLWIPNPTFGGLNDYITALVWGFGLHQLNEVARQGGPAAIGNSLRTSPG